MIYRLNKILKNDKGQSIIEYALLATFVGLAMFAMSTYAFRAVQATTTMVNDHSTNH